MVANDPQLTAGTGHCAHYITESFRQLSSGIGFTHAFPGMSRGSAARDPPSYSQACAGYHRERRLRT